MKNIKAIVIADDHYNTLGMVRSLGLASIDVTLLLMAGDNSFVDLSKFVNKCIRINRFSNDIIDEINNIAHEYVNASIVLFPLNDYAAQILDEYVCKFPKNVLCPNANGNILKFSDKYLVKSLAKSCGLYVPKGIVINLYELDVSQWNIFPAIIKPLISTEGAKKDILILYNEHDLIKEITHYKEIGYKRALIEEYIDGPDSHMVEVMGARNFDSTIDYAGIISKIREYPIKNGSTSYASIVETHEGIELDVISIFLNRINFIGLFDIEFKYANGKAYFIECNFRNGAPGFAFSLNGHNIPVVWIENNLNVIFDYKHINIKKYYFMVEQNDLINMLKGTPNFIKWIKQYRGACKLFYLKGDTKPVKTYYINFIISQILKIIKQISTYMHCALKN